MRAAYLEGAPLNERTLAQRVRRLEEVLADVASGELSVGVEIGVGEDVLTSLEMGINYLIVELRATAQANREKQEQVLAQQRELEERLRKIDQQAAAIRELSTPVIEAWDDVLVLPLIGAIDADRAGEILETLLGRISAVQARCVVIDITGVPVLDTSTADHLLRVVKAAGMLGTHCVLTGIGPAVAQTVVSLGVDLGSVKTLRNLKAGLKHCLEYLGRRVA